MKELLHLDELSASLHTAIQRFNDSVDRETLLRAIPEGLEHSVSPIRVAHEQALSHRLAYYLECDLRRIGIVDDRGPLVVDCEYNQHLFDEKKIHVLLNDAGAFKLAGRKALPVKGRDDVVAFRIRPDVLVHRRGWDGPTNLMVLEVKRWTNVDRQHDVQKLRLLTKLGLNTFGYVLGAAVYARNDRRVDKRILEVGPQFHDGRLCRQQ